MILYKKLNYVKKLSIKEILNMRRLGNISKKNYDFIPSKDMREYLAEKSFEFSDIDKATILFNTITNLEDRNAILMNILSETVDKTLQKQIQERIEFERKCIKVFIKNSNGFLYSLTYCEESDEVCGYFASYKIAKVYGDKKGKAYEVAKIPFITGNEIRIQVPQVHYNPNLFKDGKQTVQQEYDGSAIACITHDSKGNITNLWSDEINGNISDKLCFDNHRFENRYFELPHPFQRSDIVMICGSEKVGIVSNTDFSMTEKLRKVADYNDFQLVVDILEDNGNFRHYHINPIYLEHIILSDMNSKKKVLEYARNIILGTGSFDYFQNLCDGYRKEASQKI